MTPVNIELLRLEERGHRRRVDHDPMDMESRMSLAWCLFAQAMHHAGGESLLAVLRESGAVHSSAREDVEFDHDARYLLRECLMQLVAVCELSSDPIDRANVDRLRYLVAASGAESALREADAEAERLLINMGRAVVSPPVAEPRRRRRRAPRRLS